MYLQTRKLITCGGESVQKATRRVINKLFSLELQRKINYSGKNNKIKLAATNFKKIILGNQIHGSTIYILFNKFIFLTSPDAVKDIRSDFEESTAEGELKNYLQRGQERFANFEKRALLK